MCAGCGEAIDTGPKPDVDTAAAQHAYRAVAEIAAEFRHDLRCHVQQRPPHLVGADAGKPVGEPRGHSRHLRDQLGCIAGADDGEVQQR